mmetsp:Transcript_53227/g.150008  ORF Transcript_53227/g.150008 Transcript_53227/m.150008 type:complete len:277 (+) Transcript_53227:533-1363(+)
MGHPRLRRGRRQDPVGAHRRGHHQQAAAARAVHHHEAPGGHHPADEARDGRPGHAPREAHLPGHTRLPQPGDGAARGRPPRRLPPPGVRRPLHHHLLQAEGGQHDQALRARARGARALHAGERRRGQALRALPAARHGQGLRGAGHGGAHQAQPAGAREEPPRALLGGARAAEGPAPLAPPARRRGGGPRPRAAPPEARRQADLRGRRRQGRGGHARRPRPRRLRHLRGRGHALPPRRLFDGSTGIAHVCVSSKCLDACQRLHRLQRFGNEVSQCR